MNVRVLVVSSLCFFSAFSMEQALKLQWGFSDRKGNKPTMQDAHVMEHLQLDSEPAEYFGIFDGHGGAHAAQYAAKHAVELFQQSYSDSTEEGVEERINGAFITSYRLLDERMCLAYLEDGTTALSILLFRARLYIAWVGDTRAIGVEDGELPFATEDHRPSSNTREFERLNNAKAPLISNRVGTAYMNLEVSRALGDRYFKENISREILAEPEFIIVPVKNGCTVIMGCDGLWDRVSNEDAMKFVDEHRCMSEEELVEKFRYNGKPGEPCVEKGSEVVEEGASVVNKLTLIARGLRDLAFIGGSRDNISVMVLRFGEE